MDLSIGCSGCYPLLYLSTTDYDGTSGTIHYILQGSNPENHYPEQQIFQTSVRFIDYVSFDAVYCSNPVYLNRYKFITACEPTSDHTVLAELIGFSTPNYSDYVVVGSSNHNMLIRGTTVYLKNTSTTVTSDRTAKNSIEALPEQYETFVDNLSPVRFRYNEGTSGRYHVGYIAQDVEAALASAGLTSQDFAGYVDIGFTGELGLAYDEFIAALHLKIKKLEYRIHDLEKGSVAT